MKRVDDDTKRLNHNARVSRYRKSHLEKSRAISRKSAIKWYYANKEQAKVSMRKWKDANPEKVKLINKQWMSDHPKRTKELRKIYNKKYRSTITGRLRTTISNGIYHSLKGVKTKQHFELYLGYSIEELKHHIEKQFQYGMTWENYGKWHIDHIIPVSVFNFKTQDDIDFKKCWSLKNLQPMWASENFKKKAKLTKPFQPSLAMEV